MPDRYAGYDVLAKRNSPSWNEATRAVVDARLAIRATPHFFNPREWLTLLAICNRIVPQPESRPAVPIAALVDHKMANDERDGYRLASMPKMQLAWQRGLAALDAVAMAQHDQHFAVLTVAQQDELLTQMQAGKLEGADWGGMPADKFFSERLAHDIFAAYYSHPVAWSEIGFGGPASPRGYARMYFNRRDPWEAVEAKPGDDYGAVRKANERVE